MKNILLTTIYFGVLSVLCTATIFGQGNQQPPVTNGKTAVKQIRADEKPLKTLKILPAQANSKAVDIQIFAGLVKGLEIAGTNWDDKKKILTVEVENKSSISASAKALLSFSINYSYPSVTYEQGWIYDPPNPPKLGMVPKFNPFNRVLTQVYFKYALIKPLEPQKKAQFEFEIKDIQGNPYLTQQIIKDMPDETKREKRIALKIYPADTEN